MSDLIPIEGQCDLYFILKRLKGIPKVSQKVVLLHNDFMTLLCNYLYDMGYFL